MFSIAKRKLNSDYIPKKRLKLKLSPGWVFVYAIMIALVAFTALPLVYLVSTALKPLDELFVYPPQFFVRKPTFTNFFDLLTAVNSSTIPFTRYIFNSLFVTACIVTLTVIVSSLGAYANVKFHPPGSSFIFSVVVAALMFSGPVTAIPRYMIISKLGMIDTYWALIIPAIATPYNFFLMKQFSQQFPDSIIESGRIDGATEWKIFWNLAMPNMKPAWATLIVLSFVSHWNDVMPSMIYTTSQAMRQLPYAIHTINDGAGIARAGAMAAANFITISPTIIIFTAMKAKVMETMTHSGIKA